MKMDMFKNNVVIFAVVVITAFTMIWVFQDVKKDNYTDIPSHYAKLGEGYNTQLFSPCISQRCAGGPYIYTDNPYLQSVCKGVTDKELEKVSCGKGCKLGPPVAFEYTTLSNGAWDNVMCNSATGDCGFAKRRSCGCIPQSSSSLCVL
jgi:hypothetical protein